MTTPTAQGQIGSGTPRVTQAATTADQVRANLFDKLAEANNPLEQQSRVVQLVAELMSPSVVHIEAVKTVRTSGRTGTVEEAGSGVIVSLESQPYEAFVLTNAHVVRGAEWGDIMVRTSSGQRLDVLRMWEDPATDIAVIRVPARGLSPARIGISDELKIGEFVLAMGSPFGLSHSVTFGIISAKGRRNLELGDDRVRYQDFIQTDAAINPGNSGGPLVSLHGEVVGINTAIASNSGGNEGIGFSIPIRMAMHVATQLVATGEVARAFLGVTLDPRFTPEKAQTLGVDGWQGTHVVAVRPESPAAAAGLKSGDVILEFNGTPIEDDSHLINVVGITPAGSEVEVIILRDKRRELVRVKVDPLPESEKR
jgi:serine protease Do